MKGVTYCIVASQFFQEVADARGAKETSMTGLYGWVKAFKGSSLFVPRVDKELAESFDVLHVNITPRNMMILNDLREKIGYDSDTKIICNIDFAIDMWQENFKSPPITMLFRELRKADLLFHVEPHGAAIMEHMLNLSENGHKYQKVHVIPHPTDIEHVAKIRKDNREPWCGVMWHRYDNSWLPPYLALEGLPEIEKILMGFITDAKVIAPTYEYDKVYRRLEFGESIEQMSRCMIGCDPFTLYNYGRTIVDFATLGVPTVGSDRIAASHKIFPDLVVKPFDVKAMHELFKKLYMDKEFYEEQQKLGIENANYYSLKNCRKMMIDALEIEDDGYPPHFNEDFKKIWKKLNDKQWKEEYESAMGFCLLCGEYPPVSYKNGHLHIPTLGGRSQWVVKQILPEQQNIENDNYKILDVGCFQGVTIFNLLLKGYFNLTGIDLAEVAIERAIHNRSIIQEVYDDPEINVDLSEKIKFDVGWAEKLVETYGANTFDIIMGEEVLEHVRDPKIVLDQILEALKPDGKAIMTIPMKGKVPSPYHIHDFDEEALKKLFDDYSVTILSIKPFWGISLYKNKRGKEIWKAKEQMLFNLKDEENKD